MIDPIIDRSPAQRLAHIDTMRRELFELGYSVVTTSWFSEAVDRLAVAEKRTLEAAE